MQHVVACMATVGAHLLHNVVRPVVCKDALLHIGRGLEAIDPIEAPEVDTGSKRELGCRPCGICCSGIAIRAEHHRRPGLVCTPLDKLRMEMIEDAFVLVAALHALQVDCVCLEERRLKHAVAFDGRASRAHKLHRAQGIAPFDLRLTELEVCIPNGLHLMLCHSLHAHLMRRIERQVLEVLNAARCAGTQ